MKDSKIEWTHHTFNPWRGCTKVSAGCANCYADTLSKRNPLTLGVWGPNGTRVVASDAMWREPVKWDKAAKAAGERHRVFCASLADVFEDWRGSMVASNGRRLVCPHGGQFYDAAFDPDLPDCTMGDVRQRLFALIDATPNLDWLLLTKRPENIARLMPQRTCTRCFGGPCDPACPERDGFRPNVWLGTSVEDQAAADERIPHLLRVPATKRFLSCEPLLGAVDLSRWITPLQEGQDFFTALDAVCGHVTGKATGPTVFENRLHWVIVGGESGPNSRPMQPMWARSLRDQCRASGVPFFFKQWGDVMSCWNDDMPADTFVDIDKRINLAGYGGNEWFRVGKAAAGRLLDDRTWDEFPVTPN